jgi:tetratricopeptide (TPR) repeat protein
MRVLLVAVLVGCGASSPPPASVLQRPAGVKLCYSDATDRLPATRDFWTAVVAADYAARPAVLAALDAAVAAYPNDEEPALLSGLGNLWRVAEPTDAEAADQTGFLQAALNAKGRVDHAYQLCPTDYRIPAWLGPILVNMGRQLNDQPTIDKGLAVLQEGIDHDPSFVLFSKFLVYADRPASDPDFQQALAAIDANASACGDFATSRDPACINSAHVVHNVEGAAVFLGDAYGKAGQRDRALAAYQRAKQGRDYASWPFGALLDDRIANLDANLALWADGDPKNDPTAAWSSRVQCSLCHQR